MEEHSKRWISTVLSELEKLDNGKGKQILENCGRSCSHLIGSTTQAEAVRKLVGEYDLDELLKEFKKNVFKESPLYKKGNQIILEHLHKECPCPIVREVDVENSFICNCTVGHTKSVFEALLGKKLEVSLEKSNLRGDELCQLAINILN
ncbi:MAG: DUF6144 family protein [Rhodothermaceae bacterium]